MYIMNMTANVFPTQNKDLLAILCVSCRDQPGNRELKCHDGNEIAIKQKV